MITVGQETACHAPLGELIAAASSLEEQEQWRGGKGELQGQGCRVGLVGWMHEKGCFGVVVGVFCVHTYPSKGCVTEA